ncbi:MAG: MBL fold metallo-hydrolase [Lachnospiraceae bacterium]|nr:MBL fold metallo-hydrolase [Lachnospiraceae bacterium]
MRLCSIASGSSGNCIYVGHASTHLLIDAGISGKRIEQGLAENGVDPKNLSGILVTHEHSDHIQGIGVLARKYGIPLYGTVETFCAMKKGKTSIGKVDDALFQQVYPGKGLNIGEITVTPFAVSHDAANPVAYVFEAEGQKIGMATDLGVYTEQTVEYLKDSDMLYLESNHDVNMLMVGGYPYYLKQRILGEHGHLSNDTAAELLCRLYHDGLQQVLLAHLSKENNYPELAYETVKAELLLRVGEGAMPGLMVAPRDVPSGMIEVMGTV